MLLTPAPFKSAMAPAAFKVTVLLLSPMVAVPPTDKA
jgi:hypothetical protein